MSYLLGVPSYPSPPNPHVYNVPSVVKAPINYSPHENSFIGGNPFTYYGV